MKEKNVPNMKVFEMWGVIEPWEVTYKSVLRNFHGAREIVQIKDVQQRVYCIFRFPYSALILSFFLSKTILQVEVMTSLVSFFIFILL